MVHAHDQLTKYFLKMADEKKQKTNKNKNKNMVGISRHAVLLRSMEIKCDAKSHTQNVYSAIKISNYTLKIIIRTRMFNYASDIVK